MTHYLLSIYQPDGPAPDADTMAVIMADLAELDQDLRAAGAWVFAGGLFPASTATVVRSQGDALVTDGPFVEGKEHVGGVNIIRAADLDEALTWGKRLAAATTLPVEVRPFAGDPAE